jgi:hypothetical protein
MTDSTVLLRQIHPNFVQNGRPTSQAFRPTPKDEEKLSAYDGDQITAEASFQHYTTMRNLASIGAMGLTVAECLAESLPSRPDPLPDCPEHSVVDFAGFTDKDCHRKSKKLQAKAMERGWLHPAPTSHAATADSA